MLAAQFLAAALAQTTPAPAASPCARRNVDAITVHPVDPIVPWSVARLGFRGTIEVIVWLDARSAVTDVRVRVPQRGIYEPLNDIAVDAARRSSFQVEVRDCIPRPQPYVYTVEFGPEPDLETAFFDLRASPPTVSVNGRGIVRAGKRSAAAEVDVPTASAAALVDAAEGARVLAVRAGYRVRTRVAEKPHVVDTRGRRFIGEASVDPPVLPGDLVVYVFATYALER
jgi:hypothetical protein